MLSPASTSRRSPTSTANHAELLKLVVGQHDRRDHAVAERRKREPDQLGELFGSAPMRRAELRNDTSTKPWPRHTQIDRAGDQWPLHSGLYIEANRRRGRADQVREWRQQR